METWPCAVSPRGGADEPRFERAIKAASWRIDTSPATLSLPTRPDARAPNTLIPLGSIGANLGRQVTVSRTPGGGHDWEPRAVLKRVESQVHIGDGRAQRCTELTRGAGVLVGFAIQELSGCGDDPLAARVQEVRGGEIAGHAGQPVLPPFELVIQLYRQARANLDAAGDLVDRQEQLARRRFRRGVRPDEVDRCLPGGDAVLAEEQALAPDQGVAPEPNADLGALDVEGIVDEAVEQFAVQTF
jgi:hypothetical protein